MYKRRASVIKCFSNSRVNKAEIEKQITTSTNSPEYHFKYKKWKPLIDKRFVYYHRFNYFTQTKTYMLLYFVGLWQDCNAMYCNLL